MTNKAELEDERSVRIDDLQAGFEHLYENYCAPTRNLTPFNNCELNKHAF